MAASSKKQIEFHLEILPSQTKKALDFLSEKEWIGKSGWYLAGGTALGLQTGHRKSVDLDFFNEKAKFNSNIILGKFLKNNNWQTTFEEENTIYGELFNAKISFIAYPFFIPKQNYKQYGYIRILDVVDIAVMKIIAISQRGKKRDFFDLYWCAKNIESLESFIKKLRTQYPSVTHDYHHILKSLVYFSDAENDPMPETNFEATWEDVKCFFEKEAPMIAAKLINLS